MARLFTAGAEEAYINALWDTISLADLFQFNEALTTYVKPRSGNGEYRVTSTAGYMRKMFAAGAGEIYFGGACYLTGYSATMMLNFFTAVGAGTALRVVANASGVISLLRGNTTVASSAAGAMPTGQWVYIEVHLIPANTGGVFDLRVNGVSVVSFSGDTTDGDALCWGFELRANVNPTYWDDVVYNDASGTVNNSWPGQPRLIALRPAGAGLSTQMARGGLDLGANWRQARNDSHDLAFVQSATVGQKDTYALETADLPAGAVITNVIAQVRARVEAGSGTLKVTANSNGTESQGATETLGAGWKFYQHCMALNPADSLAWEEADLTTLQAGMEHTA